MGNSLKENAMSFLQLVASGEVREAYRRFSSPDFRHHNPYFRGDAESLCSPWRRMPLRILIKFLR